MKTKNNILIGIIVVVIIIAGFFIIQENILTSTTKNAQLTQSHQIFNNTNGSKNIDNSGINSEGQVITNVSEIKQAFVNKKYINSLKGYLIYKTTSCIFRNTTPPYSSKDPCFYDDDGYFILSDTNNSLNTNPANEKTTLNNNQILIYKVPDSIINSLDIGKIYKIEGSYRNRNGVDSVIFFRIPNIVDCEKLETEITTFYEIANYCNQDSDCVSSGCPEHIYNKNTDLNEVRLKEKLFYDHRCPAVEAICLSPESYNLKCIENKCIFQIITGLGF